MSYINSTPTTAHADNHSSLLVNGFHRPSSRARSPNHPLSQPNGSQSGNATDADLGVEEDPRATIFKGMYARTESRIDALLGGQFAARRKEKRRIQKGPTIPQGGEKGPPPAPPPPVAPPAKKPARTINDDYDDSDDDEDEPATSVSPLKAKSTGAANIPRVVSPVKAKLPPSPAQAHASAASTQWQGKTSDDARKKLEADKKELEENVKRSFHTMFYTFDNDRDAMLEQRRLEESDRQVDVEMSGQAHTAAAHPGEGTLSQANLGASSLVLKHLIARIDATRDRVKASDQDLRNLMVEVKKNRSKWASEEKEGQEELYEAAEKVLSELKAMTEHSQPFLQRVNKRDVPDYYTIIKQPMDLSTITRKLKQLAYKSKKDFVDDLNLIWANCLRYNSSSEHFLRHHALFMRKETEKLVPLIPEIVIRDKAEIEAEQRRAQTIEGDAEGGEDSDDEPIIASRGRKAPGKVAKKGSSNPRKAPPNPRVSTPDVDVKPSIASLANGIGSSLRNDLLRADSDTAMEGSQNGFSTPPPGTLTPGFPNGLGGSVPPSSQADAESDGFGHGTSGQPFGGPTETLYEDPEYKIWKQVTKKDRALVAAERHRLFKGYAIDPEQPALLRTKAGMRRWMKNQKDAAADALPGNQNKVTSDDAEKKDSGETLAEGMEGVENRVLPDYYDVMNAIPDLPAKLRWVEDADGKVVPATDEAMRVAPKGLFTNLESGFTNKFDSNMRQMQDTRKVVAKIGIVKQMQLQAQMYQNQFQKYEPEPFVEKDIESHVMFDNGPIMDPTVCRATLQRSVGKIFYNAGFEEFQPSALEAMTDIASEYFTKLGSTLTKYMQAPKVRVVANAETSVASVQGAGAPAERRVKYKPQYTLEESVLHTLSENGTDLEALESYVKDEVDRATGKLGVVHERTKAYLADLLRPALHPDAGPDGVNAFNDGSDQFVGGDFAEDLDEDFFGFKELGLDKEFGLASLSVPLHLLQNRMHSAYQAQNAITTGPAMPTALEPLPPYPPVTADTIPFEIRLMQDYLRTKLSANNNAPLVEDEDLPQKQRFPKPRLPPSGKISSPRKKPMREPGPGKGHPRKKMKHIEGEGWVRDELAFVGGSGKKKKKGGDGKGGNGKEGSPDVNGAAAAGDEREDGTRDATPLGPGAGRKRDANGVVKGDPVKVDPKGRGKDRDKEVEGGMISPESLEAS